MSTSILSTAQQLHSVMMDPNIEIVHLDIINDSAVLCHTRAISGALQPLKTSSIQMAIYTTAHARIRLYNALSQIPCPEKNILYMGLFSLKCIQVRKFSDTDSIVFTAERSEGNPLEHLCGDYLGQLTDELKGEMLDFVSTGAKSYAYQEKIGSQLTTKVKAKGFSMNSDAENKINFSLMRQLVNAKISNSPVEPNVTVDYECIRRKADHSLVNVKMSKEFRFTMDKRVILPDGGTLPYGFQ